MSKKAKPKDKVLWSLTIESVVRPSGAKKTLVTVNNADNKSSNEERKQNLLEFSNFCGNIVLSILGKLGKAKKEDVLKMFGLAPQEESKIIVPQGVVQ